MSNPVCQTTLAFHSHTQITARFDGGNLTSEWLLFGSLDRQDRTSVRYCGWGPTLFVKGIRNLTSDAGWLLFGSLDRLDSARTSVRVLRIAGTNATFVMSSQLIRQRDRCRVRRLQ